MTISIQRRKAVLICAEFFIFIPVNYVSFLNYILNETFVNAFTSGFENFYKDLIFPQQKNARFKTGRLVILLQRGLSPCWSKRSAFLTTKDTTYHKGKILKFPSCTFVSFVVKGFELCLVANG